MELHESADAPPVVKKPFRLAELLTAVADRLADGTATAV